MQLVGHDPSRVGGQISCTSDIYITVYNSSKITVMKWQQNNFIVEVSTARRTILKDHSIRKVENHYLSACDCIHRRLLENTNNGKIVKLSKFVLASWSL